jgi:hypothetical protein
MWTSLFQDFKNKNYLEIKVSDNEPKECERIYKLIIKSSLHRIVAMPQILQCVKIVIWMVEHTYCQNRWILDHREKPIAIYRPTNIQERYFFQRIDVDLINDWIMNKWEKLN